MLPYMIWIFVFESKVFVPHRKKEESILYGSVTDRFDTATL